MITMGNDEFILYIRKRYPDCTKTNDVIGRQIWLWLQTHAPGARKIAEDTPSYWGSVGTFLDDRHGLPKTAAQFAFDRQYLAAVYDLLDEIGQR